MEDDDAGAWEGKYTTYSSPVAAYYTVSCWLKAGSTAQANLSIYANTGHETNCNFTDLGSTFTRKTCTTTASIGAGNAWVIWRVRVGDATGDTGSIFVSGCHAESGTEAGEPCLAAGTAATCNNDGYAPDTTGWPTKAGCISLDYTPWSAGPHVSAAYFWDSSNRGTAGGVLFSRTNTNTITGVTYDAAVTNCAQATSAALTWVAGTTYNMKICWSPTLLQLYRDNVAVATDTTVNCYPSVHTTSRIGFAGVTEHGKGDWANFKVERR